jgi:hypothetical protein
MKKIVNLLRRWNRPTLGHYYHHEVMTDELERELMKAYMGTGVRGRRF